MSKWIIKAFVQKVISYLPRPELVNYFFQKHITKGVLLTDDYFEQKLKHAKDHIYYLEKYPNKTENKTILELGTGWYPIIPIVMYLTYSGRVVSIDIQDWIKRNNLIQTVQKFLEWDSNGKLKNYVNDLNEEKWENLIHIFHSASEYDTKKILEVIGLECQIQDAKELDFDDNSIDFICSNNTLEHIDKEQLIKILREFNRILKPSGIMSHSIDLSDHFSHFDSKINNYHFLRFSRKRWRLIDNNIQPQNRLRFKDYCEIYAQLGIPISEKIVSSGDIKQLEKVNIHREFADYSKEELAISHAHIISKTE